MPLYRPPAVLGGSNAAATGFTTTAVQLINPASNVNGAVVRTLAGAVNSLVNAAVYVGTAAPASVNDTTKLAVARWRQGVPSHDHMPLPIMLPAGYGAWVIASAANAENNIALSYDIV